MGNSASSAGTPAREAECFRRSILLVQAPPVLFGHDLTERTITVLRSVRLQLVRWDGAARAAERHRYAVANHIAAFYFFDPSERTVEEVVPRLEKVFLTALHSVGETVPFYACAYGAWCTELDYKNVLKQFLISRLPVPGGAVPTLGGVKNNSAAALKTMSQRAEFRLLRSEADLVQTFSSISMQSLVPKKLFSPLANLLADLVSACGADLGAMFDSRTMFPLLYVQGSPQANNDSFSYEPPTSPSRKSSTLNNPGTNNASFTKNVSAAPTPAVTTGKRVVPPLKAQSAAGLFGKVDQEKNNSNSEQQQLEEEQVRQRVIHLSLLFRRWLLPLVSADALESDSHFGEVSEPGIPFASFTTHQGTTYLAWAAKPWSYVLLNVPCGPDGELIAGNALISVNLSHFASHFSNVVDCTSEKANFTPIVPD